MRTFSVNYPTRAPGTRLFQPTKMPVVAIRTALKLNRQLVSRVRVERSDALEDQPWGGDERIMKAPITMIKELLGDMMQ